ncbi:MAG: 2,3-diphosphoglycerate synthetase [Actinomycetota bacterium]|nr:2,3-diphosphoglycerate synthetase [Actinomycetota bacterium]
MINLLKKKSNTGKDLVALIDGEHHPKVTYDAVEMLKRVYKGNFKGIIFIGGTEKISMDNIEDFFNEKVYIIKNIDLDFKDALNYFKPDIVYDLSDEPVVNYYIRMKLASFCMAIKCSYMGPDFLFSYEREDMPCKKPSISIIGTGKRIGKTAISSYVSKVFDDENIKVCVVAIGRGGPEEVKIIRGDRIDMNPEYLLGISKKGMHVGSDYIEDALTSGITTVGCRRCGGGFGGKIFMSNIKDGIKAAEGLDPELVIVEGSGASIPDVKVDRSICVIGAGQSWDNIVGYLGIYRILSADLIILTMCEKPIADEDKIDFLEKEINKINPDAPIIKTVFRPRPLSEIEGKKIFLALTSSRSIESKMKKYLEKNFRCKIIYISFNLGNRNKLRDELEKNRDYDAVLTELKAASIDVLTDFALKNNKEVIYMNNIPHILSGEKEFKKKLMELFVKENN